MKLCPYLFVYGTLLTKVKNEYAEYLTKHSRIIGQGTFQGKLYQVDWYPGAVKSENTCDKVHGQVLEISGDIATVFEVLDAYEGISRPPVISDEYVRLTTEILLDEKPLTCWIYLYQAETKGLKQIESGDFIQFQKEK